VAAADVQQAIRAIHRIESPKLIAYLTRIVRDVGSAEELAQDALLAALEHWTEHGIPDKPGAWLMTTAKHHAINLLRRRKLVDGKHADLGHMLALEQAPASLEDQLDDDVGDDLLRLVFIACHPVLSTEARVALTLRLLGGLTTEEIAAAFLVSEPTIAQRIVRAKRTLAESGVPFELPHGAARHERLASVLEVIYLIFNEGYAASAGDHYLRPGLCEDAQRLGRTLVALMPDEPEVHGLLALMELHASRSPARVGPGGEPILLLDQDRARWDALLIHRGLAGLARATQLGGSQGRYALQAAISACHARARVAQDTDWVRIAELYAELGQLSPSPVVELNRAVAVSMAWGPAEGLRLIDALRAEPALRDYPLLPGARADLLAKLGRYDEARAEFERAAALTKNARQRDLMLERAAACTQRA
jgi:RNA polymerase sigma factor (sigma-70 family)